ncbi:MULTISPECIES: V-type proton ATPase subunit E [unclassified Methanobrevibacter]|uniref:V-type ATP synthase subunit E n=1 Tax=unclassified Methanobrevibacter TaxID=2638681 RepID=UPI0027326D5D|nr:MULTISPECIES: V-type proton ATPase subunit E [unclassified Methanobrevibacter]
MSSGTSKIVESIMSEAQEKADLIIQDANAEVSAIQAKAEKSAEAEKTKILENGKKQSDMRYQQIISEAKMNARRAELGAKEEVIEAAFNQAIGELKSKASSGDDEYEDSLSKMIKEAAEEIGSDDLIIQLNEADTNKFKKDLSSQGSDSFELEGIKFTLGEPIDAMGGAVLKTINGDIEVNNTIEARLDRFKSILRSEVAEVLFK